jgi:hypothetical protein
MVVLINLQFVSRVKDFYRQPTLIPPLIVESDEEKRRTREAKARRETRLAEKTKEKECQLDPDSCL